MSHTWMSHVTHMNQTCHTHEWDMSHTRMRHVTPWPSVWKRSAVAWLGAIPLRRCFTCHIWMSHITYEWVMSRMRESRHDKAYGNVAPLFECVLYHGWDVWQRTYEWVMSHTNESCHMWMRPVTYECHGFWRRSAVARAPSNTRMSHVNESCHICLSHVQYEWAKSHMNESCHIWMSRVPFECVMSHMNEWCHICMSHGTYAWVMSYMNESRDSIWKRSAVARGLETHEWVMSHT